MYKRNFDALQNTLPKGTAVHGTRSLLRRYQKLNYVRNFWDCIKGNFDSWKCPKLNTLPKGTAVHGTGNLFRRYQK